MKKSVFMSIKKKIFLTVFAICIVLTTIFLIAAGTISSKTLKETIDTSIQRDCESSIHILSNWILERKNESSIYANTSIIKSMDENRIKPYLSEEMKKKPKEVYGIFVADEYGKCTSSDEVLNYNIEGREYFKRALEGHTSISEALTVKDCNKSIVIISAPITNDEKIVGVLGIAVDCSKFYELIYDKKIYDRDNYGYIIDDKKNVVTKCGDSNVDSELRLLNEKVTKNLTDTSKESNERIPYSTDSQGKIAYYNSIDGADGWTFISVIPSNLLNQPVKNLVLSIGGIAIGLIFLSMAIAKRVGEGISKPIIKLSKIFQRAADGDLRVVADEKGNDEVTNAAKNFNVMMKSINNMVYLDSLTNLQNRKSFVNILNLNIEQCKDTKEKLGVMSLGIDKFKNVNDVYGHSCGDILLKDIAEKLKEIFGGECVVGRMTGDEFLILIKNHVSVESVSKRAETILKTFREPWQLRYGEIYITASIGIAIYPNDGINSELLIKNATVAKSKAKGNGGDEFCIYSPEMNKVIEEQVILDSMLHNAIEKNEFIIYYQPFISANTGKVEAVEALLRWNSKELGLVAPGKFINRVEENGLIVPIGNWVLREACRQNAQWIAMGYRPICVSVNVSPKQFEKEDFIEEVRKVLKETNLEAKYLELEITEGVAMGNVEDKINKLLELKTMGIKISIDDFGTGYSSLNYLNRFPIDNLKIDRSFVSDITNDNSKSIITTIVSIANNLKLGLIAEGVETREQLNFIKSQRCDKIQGFLFSKPLEPIKFEEILKEDRVFA